MADSKRSHNASLMSKGLEQFVSEEQARRMAATQGGHTMLLIDARHGRLLRDEDGTERIQVHADHVEVVPAEQEDRVREFMRALYLARPEQFGQAAFEDTTSGPDLATAAAQIDAAVERDDTGAPTGVWDGNPDGPVTAEDIEAAAAEDEFVECPHPLCLLAEDHEGDHDPS